MVEKRGAASGSSRSPRREKPQRIADGLRQLIVAGEYAEGDPLGNERDLIERFGVSRPSMREALRILEAEGLISVVRGARGGVIVHEPDHRQTARSFSLVLQARTVPLSDVFSTRTIIEPAIVRMLAGSRGNKSAAERLRELIAAEEEVVDDPEAFAEANAQFHEELISMGDNQTLSIVYEMLDEIITRAVAAVGMNDGDGASVATRQRGLRGQRRLADLIEAGDVEAAEEHWRKHMTRVGQVMLGLQAQTVVDLMNHH